MSLIVRTIAKLVSGLIFVFGLYIVAHGHLTPGGGFAGGIVISASFILSLIAFGKDKLRLTYDKNKASFLETIGISLFWLIAFLGLVFTGMYFLNFLSKGKNFMLFSAGFIPLSNVAIGIEVASALVSIIFAFVILYLIEEKEE
jgi:multicomponent Na+:H+ antiporter subunit B